MGHGARSAVAFVFLLRQARIARLVDVRAYPVSRRHPQFTRDALSQSLREAGIAYDWQGRGLGGMWFISWRRTKFTSTPGGFSSRARNGQDPLTEAAFPSR